MTARRCRESACRRARPRASAVALLPMLALAVGTAAAAPEPAASGQAAASATAAACGQGLDPRLRRLVSTPRQQLAFVPIPGQLAVGRHFSLDLVVCPRPGWSLPLAVRVDADMPAHRHGMNYRPTVRQLGDGRYRVDGLMLHMPGRWRLLFDLSADGRIERLSHELDLE